MNSRILADIEELDTKVRKTIEDYSLTNKDEKVIVACSGGKDSTTALYLLHKLGYEVEALTIDLKIGDWSSKNLENLREFCENHSIVLNEVNIREELGHSICHLRSMIKSKKDLKNCTICGVLRRWMINKKARELEGDKLVTGHNMDDEAQTIFMNMLKGKPSANKSVGPKVGTQTDPKFVDRIKPLFFCYEEEIKEYSRDKNFPVIYEPCPCASTSFRVKIKKWLRERDPEFKKNLVCTTLSISDSFERKNKERSYCERCGEPSSNELCRACRLFKVIEDE